MMPYSNGKVSKFSKRHIASIFGMYVPSETNFFRGISTLKMLNTIKIISSLTWSLELL
jgi:hypothetical protein